MHWAVKYIGMPYVAGARGPESVDCWGLLYLAYRNEFQIELPLYPGLAGFTPETLAVASSELQTSWKRIDSPREGSLVTMTKKDMIEHVGIYTKSDGGKLIHCSDFTQVCADTLRRIKIRGVRSFSFYQHSLWPT